MKYLFVNGAEEIWGAEESMVVLARSLKSSGHEVELECFSQTVADFWKSEVKSEYRLVTTDSKKMSNTHKCIRYCSRPMQDKSVQVVLIFSHFLFPKAMAEKLKIALKFSKVSKRTVWAADLHDSFHSWKSYLNFNFFIRFLDRIIAVSEFTASQVHESCKDRVLICTRALELDFSGRPALSTTPSNGCLRVGIVGRLDPEKNHLLLASALQQTAAPHKMIIRGKSSHYHEGYSTHLLETIEKMLGPRLQYQGVFPREAALRDLDLLVVANHFEPMGRTVLEAMQFGVPTVVPDQGGSAELVIDRVNGLKYKANDARSLADTLDFAAENPQLLRDFSAEAWENLKRQHSSETYGEIISNFITRKISDG